MTLQLVAGGFQADLVSDRACTLEWPAVQPGMAVKGWMLPMFEGVYVPADDLRWRSFLEKSGPLDTTADLILPFWGLDLGDSTLTCILLNPFNNRLEFESAGDRLRMLLAHEFTRNQQVQQSVFGDRVELVANFGDQTFNRDGLTVPAHSIAAIWRDTKKRVVYTVSRDQPF